MFLLLSSIYNSISPNDGDPQPRWRSAPKHVWSPVLNNVCFSHRVEVLPLLYQSFLLLMCEAPLSVYWNGQRCFAIQISLVAYSRHSWVRYVFYKLNEWIFILTKLCVSWSLFSSSCLRRIRYTSLKFAGWCFISIPNTCHNVTSASSSELFSC